MQCRLASVSYTHLDVYKRQGQLWNQLIRVVNLTVIADSVLIAVVGARHGLVAAQDVTCLLYTSCVMLLFSFSLFIIPVFCLFLLDIFFLLQLLFTAIYLLLKHILAEFSIGYAHDIRDFMITYAVPHLF